MKFLNRHFFEDPEEMEYRKQKEEKRRERVIIDCQQWESKDKQAFRDIIEIPVGIFMKEIPEPADVQLHERLITRQECHIYYGKKYCYHTDQGEVITDAYV